METSSLAPTAQTLEVPGAHLYYEVRGRGPLVVLVGAPMDARPFGPLADLLASDYTVLTTDPRGINRSPVNDPSQDSTPARTRPRRCAPTIFPGWWPVLTQARPWSSA